MSPLDLIAAAEAKARDAESNLASAHGALKAARARLGSVPNYEVLALAQAQAVLAQAYAALALAKTGLGLLEVTSDGAAPQPGPEALTTPCDGTCGSTDPHDAHLAPGAAEYLGRQDSDG